MQWFFTFISDLQTNVTVTLYLGEQHTMCFYIQVQNSFAPAGNSAAGIQLVSCVICEQRQN